jgi:glyoxylase-like metal-dependent hydrolase (beta-lactamase superfamily II)
MKLKPTQAFTAPLNSSRRKTVLGLGAVSAGQALAGSGFGLVAQGFMLANAQAAAPKVGGQQISVHRMKLGEFEVTTLLDGYLDVPVGVLQGDAAHIREHLESAGLAKDAPIRLPVNAFLVNTGSKLVLVDAGGAKLIGPTAGRLPQCLSAAGVTPEQIDEVYITHMHGDHLHGTVTPEGGRLFPNAVIRIAKEDVDHWANPQVEAAAPENQKGRFVAAKRAVAAYGDRIKPFTLGEELTPGIRSVAAVGHTPGHSCYMVESAGAKLLLLGDLMHVAPVQFPRPEITVAFDHHQPTARDIRAKLFEQVAREKILVGAVHVAFPGIGRLRQSGTGYAFDPIAWQLF